MKELHIEQADVSASELKLAMQLIDQIAEDTYDPNAFQDEEKKRILAAIDEKIAGKRIVAAPPAAEAGQGGQVIDLMEALRASLSKKPAKAATSKQADDLPVGALKERKPARRVVKADEPVTMPARSRVRK